MGKYLNDIMLHMHTADKKNNFSAEQSMAMKYCSLIESLFNFYLPKKIEIGNNIWRLHIHITNEQVLNGKTEISGLCLEVYICNDLSQFDQLNNCERKKLLLEICLNGIKHCCIAQNYSPQIFISIYDKIIEQEIVFDLNYKERKNSPDKKHFAQLKGFLSEDYEHRKTSVSIFDKQQIHLKDIFIGNYIFLAFDRVAWADSSTIHAFHINSIQSYRSKKVATDYYSIDIFTNVVNYFPVSKESIFEYAVKLLTETNEFEKAINLIYRAKELGHGKAENILLNLKYNPDLRDKNQLLQMPKKSKK